MPIYSEQFNCEHCQIIWVSWRNSKMCSTKCMQIKLILPPFSVQFAIHWTESHQPNNWVNECWMNEIRTVYDQIYTHSMSNAYWTEYLHKNCGSYVVVCLYGILHNWSSLWLVCIRSNVRILRFEKVLVVYLNQKQVLIKTYFGQYLHA